MHGETVKNSEIIWIFICNLDQRKGKMPLSSAQDSFTLKWEERKKKLLQNFRISPYITLQNKV
jgi:hypothetical protein